MKWKQLLDHELDETYRSSRNLIQLLRESDLDWKPSSGSNWMDVAQLLMHMTTACGVPTAEFVNGCDGSPEDLEANQLTLEDMLPPAEHMPRVHTIAEALQLLEKDRLMAIAALKSCPEEQLEHNTITTLWDNTPRPLGYRILQMTGHLSQHKTQLFYYMKLMGYPVNTRSLYLTSP